ncbi:nuclease EXOG, mitochondrial isoform X2 [Brachyhypopomus gauderio]|uniref:nuclease EXOG, mitochondrial isoform X2 n=1 Tax=Brachyhypopomus gauderio TaxID=698409 RepID=UPI004042D11B
MFCRMTRPGGHPDGWQSTCQTKNSSEEQTESTANSSQTPVFQSFSLRTTMITLVVDGLEDTWHQLLTVNFQRQGNIYHHKLLSSLNDKRYILVAPHSFCELTLQGHPPNTKKPKSMAETFYLSNIVPQNYENNGGFWNRLEMYCRELTERFSDVWVISGPLTLPQVHQDGKRMVSYQLIGKDDVAVPTHLYKVILVQKDPSAEPMALGAFVVPNAPIGFEHHLKEYQVSLTDLERMSGLIFFPEIEKSKDLKNLCLVDTCELMDFKRFTLYISSRKVASARTLARLEKIMSELEDAEITPDNYLATLYQEKKQELLKKESPQSQSE